MGQRHQIFIKTINPYHVEYDKSKKAELKKAFGTNKTTVFAFHNQWLYGRSALLSALNVLEFSEGLTKKEKMGDSSAYNNPFANDGVRMMGYEKLKTVMEAVLNLCREENSYRGKGWLGSFLLNEEEPEMREFFTYGDNNDGITIIDAIENKYCFMNIYEKNKEIKNDARDLESLTPITGKQFVEAYNPSTAKLARNTYYGKQALEDEGDKGFMKYLIETKKTNKSLIKRLDKFKVLTESELRKMFKKQYAEIDGERLAEERGIVDGEKLKAMLIKG